MPIYEYRCDNGHEFEVFQAMADDPVTICDVCGAAVQRVFSPVAVHYKGSGFYTTDYAKKGSAKPASSSDSGSMIGVCSANTERICCDTALYTSKRGRTKISSGHCRRATIPDMAERTPKRLAS